MTFKHPVLASFWLVVLAVGLALFLGFMPGLEFYTRADNQEIHWTQTGFLNEARTFLATATLLPDGRVLLAGGQVGQDGSGLGISYAAATAELYDSATGAFLPTGSLLAARTGHTATVLPDGQVLIAGGVDGASQYHATAERYDPSTGVFRQTGAMAVARGGHIAVRLSTGKVLIAGGYNGTKFLNSAELYDPATGTFAPTGSLNVARSNFSAVLLDSGMVLVVGGYGASSTMVLDSAELYDPVTETFTLTGSLQTARAGFHLAVRLSTGKALVAGGVGANGQGLASVELYDPESRTFSELESLITGREHHSLTRLPNGQVLIVGGWTGMEGVVLTSAELYDPQTNTVSVTEPLVEGRGFHTATLLNDGTVLVVGGSREASYTSQALASAEIFTCISCMVPPEAPTQLTAADVPSDQGGAVQLTWLPPANAVIHEYRVYSSTTAGGPYSLIATLADPPSTTYRDTGLTNHVRYYYVVRAFDGYRESADSEEVNATPIDNLAPAAPSALTVLDTPADDGTALSLTWVSSTSTDVLEQRVYRSATAGGPYTRVATLSGNAATSFIDYGLTPGVTYHYVLAAYDGTQESPFTSEGTGQPIDNRPWGEALQINLVEDGSASLTLRGHDPEGSPVTYHIVSQPAHGVLLGTAPQLTYIPSPDFNGLDSFTYTVSDGVLTGQPATVTLAVAAMNDSPLAIPDSLSILEDAHDVLLDVLANDTTAPDVGEILTITAVSSPSQGGMVAIAANQRNLLYTPAANFAGIETFTYTITDGVPGSEAMATVSVTVTPVNDAPSVAPLTLLWEPSPSPNVVEQRIYRSLTAGGPYRLVGSIKDPAATTFIDRQNLHVGTRYYYVVRAFDGAIESAYSNEASGVSGMRTVSTAVGTPVEVTLPGYDIDGDPLEYTIVQGPAHGILQGDGPTRVYTPDPDFVGTDSLMYTVSDGSLTSETGTLTFMIGVQSE
ncbi:MAG: tandem-95 repeat protein [Nitrospirae bacterium]|nr:MAG: tandem-95 repeat protein [Nitrospirota bacterium]